MSRSSVALMLQGWLQFSVELLAQGFDLPALCRRIRHVSRSQTARITAPRGAGSAMRPAFSGRSAGTLENSWKRHGISSVRASDFMDSPVWFSGRWLCACLTRNRSEPAMPTTQTPRRLGPFVLAVTLLGAPPTVRAGTDRCYRPERTGVGAP